MGTDCPEEDAADGYAREGVRGVGRGGHAAVDGGAAVGKRRPHPGLPWRATARTYRG